MGGVALNLSGEQLLPQHKRPPDGLVAHSHHLDKVGVDSVSLISSPRLAVRMWSWVTVGWVMRHRRGTAGRAAWRWCGAAAARPGRRADTRARSWRRRCRRPRRRARHRPGPGRAVRGVHQRRRWWRNRPPRVLRLAGPEHNRGDGTGLSGGAGFGFEGFQQQPLDGGCDRWLSDRLTRRLLLLPCSPAPLLCCSYVEWFSDDSVNDSMSDSWIGHGGKRETLGRLMRWCSAQWTAWR